MYAVRSVTPIPPLASRVLNRCEHFKRDHDLIEAVKDVGTESTRMHLLLERYVRGRNDTHVHWH